MQPSTATRTHNSTHSTTSAKQQHNKSAAARAQEFVGRITYGNTLPPVPLDPKLLKYPFDSLRLVKYQPTSLEATYQRAIHTEPDLGVHIDLLDPRAAAPPVPTPPLAPEDERLLHPAAAGANNVKAAKRRADRPSVPWLQKTKYISSQVSMEIPRPRTDVHERRRGEFQEDQQANSKEAQVELIDRSFEAAKKPVHPTNPALRPVQVLPVFPNFDLWQNNYSQVVFDRDPTPKHDREQLVEEDQEITKHAIIKGYSGGKFVAYLLPKKRAREDEESEQEYVWIREYSFAIKKGSEFKDAYFLTMDEDKVTYNEIAARVNLTKMKKKDAALQRPSKITAVFRNLDEGELAAREANKKEFMQPQLLKKEDEDEPDEVLVDEDEGREAESTQS